MKASADDLADTRIAFANLQMLFPIVGIVIVWAKFELSAKKCRLATLNTEGPSASMHDRHLKVG